MTFSLVMASQPSLRFLEGTSKCDIMNLVVLTNDRCIAIPIGSTILDNVLTRLIHQSLPYLDPATVLKAGALNLRLVTSDETTLHILRSVYARAVTQIMLFALIITCLGFLATFGIHWKNLKTINPDRAHAESDKTSPQAWASEACPPESLSFPTGQENGGRPVD